VHNAAQDLADIRKVMIDAQTKIEVAQINAGVGMHRNVIDATAQRDQMDHDMHNAAQDRLMQAHDIETDAALRAHDINTAAQVAQYQHGQQAGLPASPAS
jgi:hypothetical protein